MTEVSRLPSDLATPRAAEETSYPINCQLSDEIVNAQQPIILRGIVKHWPVVETAEKSASSLFDYLSRFDKGAIVPVTVGGSTLGGRIFYNDAFDGANADHGNARMSEVLRRIAAGADRDDAPLIYLASVTVDDVLPGFREHNDVPFGDTNPLASIWIGSRTRIAAHNDLPLNLACVAAGRRRFILFPPDQTPNLYIGPFEVTPAGRPISLVDFAQPDLERFPRFAEAMKHAIVANLEPGDGLFIPSMWWHHVESLSGFNILVNYWWRTVPAFLGTPQDVLNHAMMTIRDLPQGERDIWRDVFDHYVFQANDETAAHVPEHAKGILGKIDAEGARRTRSYLLNRLNR
ncbi:MAG: cupin-like domain-containing protein [Pseudomonadota bacterium]